jgi:hypothetical protein
MRDFTWPQVAALFILVAGVLTALVTKSVELAVVVAVVQAIAPSVFATKKEK